MAQCRVTDQDGIVREMVHELPPQQLLVLVRVRPLEGVAAPRPARGDARGEARVARAELARAVVSQAADAAGGVRAVRLLSL